MKFRMKKCKECGQYTLKETCPQCNHKVGVIFPPRYSPQDKYGKYRRKIKQEEWDIHNFKQNKTMEQ